MLFRSLQLWPDANHIELYPAYARPLTQLVSMVRPSWLADKLMSPTFQRMRLPIADADRIGYLTEIREFIAAVRFGVFIDCSACKLWVRDQCHSTAILKVRRAANVFRL